MLTMTYKKRNEAAIKTLDPVMQVLVKFFMFRLWRAGEDVLIVEGFRDKEDQNREVAEGNSFVYWPYSFHNHGIAIDVVPVLFGQTTILWNATARYERIARVAKSVGMEWGYEMWKFDKPHYQYRQGQPIEYFIKGGKLDAKIFIQGVLDGYKNEIRKMENGLRFARGKRLEQLQQAIAYAKSLQEYALLWA